MTSTLIDLTIGKKYIDCSLFQLIFRRDKNQNMKFYSASALLVAALAPQADAFSSCSRKPSFYGRGSSSLKMSMKPAFDALSSKVQDKLGLQATDFTEVTGGKS